MSTDLRTSSGVRTLGLKNPQVGNAQLGAGTNGFVSNSTGSLESTRSSRSLRHVAREWFATPKVTDIRMAGTLTILSVVAILISGYLAYHALTAGKVAGCGSGGAFDCSHVLTSHWSKVLGMPVSIPAIGLYVVLISAIWFVPANSRQRRWQGMMISFLTASAAIGAIWFITLQVAWIGHICPYCMVIHTCGLLCAAIVLLTLSLNAFDRLISVGAAVLGVCGLIAVQMLTPEVEQFELIDNSTIEAIVPASDIEPGLMEAPTVDAPAGVFDSPMSDSPVFDSPVFDSPVFDSPVFDSPVFDSPVFDSPAVESSESAIEPETSSDSAVFESPLGQLQPDMRSRFAVWALLAGQCASGNATAILLSQVTDTPVAPVEASSGESAESQLDGSAASDASASESSDSVAEQKPGDVSTAEGGASAEGASVAKGDSAATNKPAESDAKPAETTPPAPEHNAKILGGLELRPHQWPLLGPTDAKFLVVEMFDYTCSHCQATQIAIRGAREHFGKDLAVIVLPVPMSRNCNPYAAGSSSHANACELSKLAIAVWRVAPERFEEFHDFVLANRGNYTSAKQKASEIASASALETELKSGLPEKYLQKTSELYNRAGRGSIPKILFPKTSAVGEMRTATTLISLIERELKE